MSVVVRMLSDRGMCLPKSRTETHLLEAVASECECVFQFHQEM
jgi:hypothetical protein